MAIILHYLEESRSQRVAWLLEELGVEYELKVYSRNEDFRAGPELKKVHPLGKSPILEIDGEQLVESEVIINYLIAKHGKQFGFEDEKLQRQVATYMAHCEGSLQPPLLILRISNKVREAKGVSFMVRPVAKEIANKIDAGFPTPEVELGLEYLEKQLAANGTGFFVGDHLSGADFMYSYPLAGARKFGLLTEENHPNLFKFLTTVESKDTFKAAAKKAADAPALH